MAQTIFYVYEVEGGFINIDKFLKIKKVKSIDKAGYWILKSQAKSWASVIKDKFPTAVMKEATLRIV